MPNNLRTLLKEEYTACKQLLATYKEIEDQEDYRFLALCLQNAKLALESLNYNQIKDALEQLSSFDD